MSEATIVIVYTLYGNRSSAERAAEALVASRLAACANILAPCQSHYMWNGQAEKQEEHPVLFKTTGAAREALMAAIAADHPYDVPAILSWEAGAAMPYADWVGSMTGAL